MPNKKPEASGSDTKGIDKSNKQGNSTASEQGKPETKGQWDSSTPKQGAPKSPQTPAPGTPKTNPDDSKQGENSEQQEKIKKIDALTLKSSIKKESSKMKIKRKFILLFQF